MERKTLLKTTVLLGFMFFMFACNPNKQPQKKHNKEALNLLEKTEKAIHSSTQKSFTLTIDEKKKNSEGKIQKEHSVCDIKAIYPNKLFVDSKKANNSFKYWYDGKYFTYYSTDENNYVTLDAPATTVALIDTMHNRFGLKFPAGDFFYPSFQKDIQNFFDKIDIGNKEEIAGEKCTEIIAKNNEISINIWISDATSLPIKFNIFQNKNKDIKYQAIFSNWNLNPALDNSIFDFVAPENAHSINIMSK